MSLLIEKTLIFALSIFLSIGALLVFINDVIPLLRAILEAYGKTFGEVRTLHFCAFYEGFFPEGFPTWNI